MKLVSTLLALGIFSSITLYHVWNPSQIRRSPSSPAAEAVQITYQKDIEFFLTSLGEFEDLVKSVSMERKDLLHASFFKCRNNYKKIEFIAEYLDPGFMKSFNGPNLPKLDENPLSQTIIEPQGFQVMEELIFNDSVYFYKAEISHLIKELKGNAQILKSRNIQLTDRMVFEACRAEVLRIVSLGLTGFDAPVTRHSVPEAAVALESIHQALRFYYLSIQNKSPEIKNKLDGTIQEAIAFLGKSDNFEKFDRLHFIKNFANPIYQLILDGHKACGIETIHEAIPFNVAVNYNADNIFDQDLLNPFYYNRVKIDSENKKITSLGKLLFFDPVFSANNQRSCASCHNPAKAFTDAVSKSVAMDFKGDVGRNSPTLINAVFQSSYFYDLRAKYPEEQIDHVVFNHKEFNTDFESIIRKLKASQEYVKLFQEAFPKVPGNAIDGYTLNKALADYVRSLVAFNSPFDQYMRGEKTEISEEVKRGFNLFMGKAQCGTCHFAPVFNGTVPPHFIETEAEVLGVTATADFTNPALDEDLGRYNLRRSPIYRNSFKTSTVRNAALTAPYMHNGVYKSLEEVMDFYNKGGGGGLGLDVPNQTLSSDPLNLKQEEIKDIISFIHALTDTSGLTSVPASLPMFPGDPSLNKRKIAGDY